jgi:hypothetical protein
MRGRRPELEKRPQSVRALGFGVLGICTVICWSGASAFCGNLAIGQTTVPSQPFAAEQTQEGTGPSAPASNPTGGFVSSFSPSFGTAEARPGNETALTAPPLVPPVQPAAAGYGLPATGEACGALGDVQQAFCEECPKWGVLTFVGYDSFRGVSDGSWQNNGIHVGSNLGTWLGPVGEATGIGFQIGGSVGVYDWSGADYRPREIAVETQGFITYGFFRKPNQGSKWSAAVVQDWMLNNNFGEYSANPSLSQLRAQLGYAFSASNEIGLWGTCRVLSDTHFVNGVGSTTWRPIDQLNLYWHHKWELAGADTSIWIGIPEQDRLGGGGSLGEYIAGASANIPLSRRLSLYTLVTYMHPSAGPGGAGSEEDEWNFTVGLAFYPGGNARSNSVAGQCWMPQLPVADNGYFMVDTNHH